MAAYKTWEEVLDAVRDSSSDQSFIIHMNEGDKEVDRTRFMSKTEAIAYCFYKMGRQRIGF